MGNRLAWRNLAAVKTSNIWRQTETNVKRAFLQIQQHFISIPLFEIIVIRMGSREFS